MKSASTWSPSLPCATLLGMNIATVFTLPPLEPGPVILPLSDEFQGLLNNSCTDAKYAFSPACENLGDVPGDATPENPSSFTNINGDVRLEPHACHATCSGCESVPGSDTGDGECKSSEGYVYCPELDECILPFQQNCPIGGVSLSGPIDITCDTESRCNGLSHDCTITDEVTGTVFGGPYLPGLDDQYSLQEGCEMICQGCESIPGSDLGDNGCVASEGYEYCSELHQCIQPFE